MIRSAMTLPHRLLFAVACAWVAWAARGELRANAAPPPALPATETAIFAGGCFWCMEAPFEHVEGVISVTSGFTGGKEPNPSYEMVSSGSTGHRESIFVRFDPRKVSYRRLLQVFWRNIDPTAKNRQFCDVGRQYSSAIFVQNDAQRRTAEVSLRLIERYLASRGLGPVQTPILPATRFYPAPAYHQDFYRKDPQRYTSYRQGCGRDRRLKQLWGAPKAR